MYNINNILEATNKPYVTQADLNRIDKALNAAYYNYRTSETKTLAELRIMYNKEKQAWDNGYFGSFGYWLDRNHWELCEK